MKNAFSDRLKQLRLSMNLTQEEIAQKIGLSTTGYYKYEVGKTTPKLDVIVKLKNVFKVNIDWLIDGTGPMFRVIEFNERILNNNDILDFFYWLNEYPIVQFATLTFFEELKSKYPEMFLNKNQKTRGEKKP